MTKEKKNKEIIKIILIFALVFILIPLIVFMLVYFTNKDFKKSTNEYLRNTPGIVGEYFSKYPTESEREEKELYLANYYLSIKEESSADKLYIIKKSDEELYNNIIKNMNRKSANKTKDIIILVRNIELRKDLLHTLYDEIKDEEEAELSEEIRRLENLELILAIRDIEILSERTDSKNELRRIFSNINLKTATDMLYYIQPDVYDKIISNIDSNRRKEIESLLLQKDKKFNELYSKAKVYEVMDTERAISELGNTDSYKIDDLSKIYMNLSISKAAEILLGADEDFVNDVISSIEIFEELLGESESRTVKIMQTISFKKQYNQKIDELVVLYEKIEPVEVVKIVEKMIKNKNSVTIFEIDEDTIYTISDSSIILDVLKNMKKQKVSQILSIMDPNDAASITRELAI
ncbi:MAG: hypothetical protein WDA24_03070 [Tissierellales bacterium]